MILLFVYLFNQQRKRNLCLHIFLALFINTSQVNIGSFNCIASNQNRIFVLLGRIFIIRIAFTIATYF
jgi:hypothetical protein